MAPSPVEELDLLDLERSNKGASKQRRDQINSEIGTMRDLLPLPESARQRLSQLQIMSLSCVYIRKCNILQKLFQTSSCTAEIPCDFSQALTGFLLVTTRDGKLVYISENVTEFLGHSMVDMKTQGDSLFDIVDKRDHSTVQAQLLHGGGELKPPGQEEVSFFCRMNMSRTLKRQAGFGDVKVMHVRGHFVTTTVHDAVPEKEVFLAVCTPLITPDIKESLIQNNTMIFKSVHQLDMNYLEITQNGEYHMGLSNDEIFQKSWYSGLHPEDIHEAREKHIQLIKSRHEMGCMMTVRMIKQDGSIIWVNIVMHVRQGVVSNSNDPVIVCINQVISEQEAYQFKIQGQLFALYASRTPDIFFGAHYYASVVPTVEGEIYAQQSPGFSPHSGFYPAQPAYDRTFFESPAACQIAHPVPYIAARGSDVNGRQGHTDTLRALKRKLQENYFSTCKPNKVPRLSSNSARGSGSDGFFSRGSVSASMSNGTNAYRNNIGQCISVNGHGNSSLGMVQTVMRGGPNPHVLPKENSVIMDRFPTMLSPPHSGTSASSFEQVVPEVQLPACYLTPDPSPAASPEPCDNSKTGGSTVVRDSLDPVLLSTRLSNIKREVHPDIPPAKLQEIKKNGIKTKLLPIVDASFVESFFDELDQKPTLLELQHFADRMSKELSGTSKAAEVPVTQSVSAKLSEQFVPVSVGTKVTEPVIHPSRSEPAVTHSPRSTEPIIHPSTSTPAEQQPVLPQISELLENLFGAEVPDFESPIKVKEETRQTTPKSHDQQVLAPDTVCWSPSGSPLAIEIEHHNPKFSTCMMTPDSEIDSDPYEDVLDPDSWMTFPMDVSDVTGKPAQKQAFDRSLLSKGDNEEDELYQLKQLLSTWTQADVLVRRDSQ